MEFRLSVIRIRVLVIVVCIGVLSAAGPVYGEEALVLVAREDSSIGELNSLEIRKLYLGFNVRDRSDRQIYAITNLSDARLMKVFLQNVMAMTERAYNRRLLTLAVQSGRARPRQASSLEELHRYLTTNSMVVSCMWKKDVEKFGDLKVIKVLWAD